MVPKKWGPNINIRGEQFGDLIQTSWWKKQLLPNNFTSDIHLGELNHASYCWWLKSCTTWDVWNPIKNGINYHINWCRISAINSMFHQFNHFNKGAFEPPYFSFAKPWCLPLLLTEVFNLKKIASKILSRCRLWNTIRWSAKVDFSSVFFSFACLGSS